MMSPRSITECRRSADFGAYLASVHERDIDLLLMEEFHASPEFTAWFASEAGVPEAQFDGAWHSVTDADGETDLLLRVRSEAKRIAILIENKVCAGEQDRQDERYHLRAARAQGQGKCDSFVTCMCAPQAYLAGLPSSSLYDAKVAYEAICTWFAGIDDPRARWRQAVMEEAIAQGRRGYNMIVNESVSAFHMEFWRYLQRNHPRLLMRRPTAKGNKSNWILFNGVGFPKNVGFHLKLDQCVVELGFKNRLVEDLAAVQIEWRGEIFMVQKGGTAALSISVPHLDRNRGLETQREALKAVMAAVDILAPYADALENSAPAPRRT